MAASPQGFDYYKSAAPSTRWFLVAQLLDAIRLADLKLLEFMFIVLHRNYNYIEIW